jgi:hypothetical protein
MQRRWILPKNHKYCAIKQQFDGEQESELPPTHHSEKFVFKMVKNICVVFRKGVKEKTKERGKCLKAGCTILKNNRFSLGIYPIGKNWRLVLPSTLCMLQRVYLKALLTLY